MEIFLNGPALFVKEHELLTTFKNLIEGLNGWVHLSVVG